MDTWANFYGAERLQCRPKGSKIWDYLGHDSFFRRKKGFPSRFFIGNNLIVVNCTLGPNRPTGFSKAFDHVFESEVLALICLLKVSREGSFLLSVSASVSCTPARLNACTGTPLSWLLEGENPFSSGLLCSAPLCRFGSLFGKANQTVSSRQKSSCGTILSGKEQVEKSPFSPVWISPDMVLCDQWKGLGKTKGTV